MNKSIKVILFDLGGVLVELGASPLPADALPDENAFTLADWFKSDAAIAFEKGASTATSFAQTLIADLNLNCSEERLIEHFTYWPTGLFPGAQELLKHLQQNYRLAILTNTNELHWPRFSAEFGLLEYVEHIFASHQLAMVKPEPGIYQHVLTTLDVDPDRVLFLDDNSGNVKAARELGISAHLVNGFDQLKHFLIAQGIIDRM
jgi:HAD superfamily hydrolase (TIGR01509 family)